MFAYTHLALRRAAHVARASGKATSSGARVVARKAPATRLVNVQKRFLRNTLYSSTKSRLYSTSHLDDLPATKVTQIEQLMEKASDLSAQAADLNDRGHYENAESLLEGALALRAKGHAELTKLGAMSPKMGDWSLVTAQLQAQLAFTKTSLSKHVEAIGLYEQCLPVIETYQKNERDRAVVLSNYAECLCSVDKPHDAIANASTAVSILKSLSQNDELMAACMANLAGYYCKVKRFADAKPLAAQALRLFIDKLGRRNQYTKNAWSNYYCILKELGQDEEAKDLEEDWRTAHEGPTTSKHAEKLNTAQVEEIRRRLEERLYAPKRVEPTGTVKHPEFYRDELKEFMQQWKEAGLDVDDPAHAKVLQQELTALKRGHEVGKEAFVRETERIANVAAQHGEDWSTMLDELDVIAAQAREVDDMLAAERAEKTQKELADRQANKKPRGPSKELLEEIVKIKERKAEQARIRAEAERAAAEAAAKAAAEAAAKASKGKGKKR